MQERKHMRKIPKGGVNGGVSMWQDPIVQDIRKAGEELTKQANYNLHTFFQKLRNNEKQKNHTVISRLKKEKKPDVR